MVIPVVRYSVVHSSYFFRFFTDEAEIETNVGSQVKNIVILILAIVGRSVGFFKLNMSKVRL